MQQTQLEKRGAHGSLCYTTRNAGGSLVHIAFVFACLYVRKEWADWSGRLRENFRISEVVSEVNNRIRDEARSLYDQLTKHNSDEAGKGQGPGGKGDSKGEFVRMCSYTNCCTQLVLKAEKAEKARRAKSAPALPVKTTTALSEGPSNVSIATSGGTSRLTAHSSRRDQMLRELPLRMVLDYLYR